MKKISKKTVLSLAQKALAAGNPYIKKAVCFMIAREDRYIYAEQVMTKKEIDDAYLKTAAYDVERGYNERTAGFYDKFYRYTRADGGRAYDLGVSLAAERGCKGEMTIIPYSV